MAVDPTPIDAEAVGECESAIPEQEVLELVVRAFDALADPTRVKLLYALLKRPLCVRDRAITVGASESAVSHQLRLLRDRHLVKPTRKGHWSSTDSMIIISPHSSRRRNTRLIMSAGRS